MKSFLFGVASTIAIVEALAIVVLADDESRERRLREYAERRKETNYDRT